MADDFAGVTPAGGASPAPTKSNGAEESDRAISNLKERTKEFLQVVSDF